MATRERGGSGSTTTRSRSASSRVSTDREEIRSWAEVRGASPARVPDTNILRLDFAGYSGDDTLEHISWDEFFELFDRNNLALLYQEETARGQRSNFNKLIDRSTAENGGSSGNRGQRTRARGRTTRAQSGSGRRQRRKTGTRSGSARRSSSRRSTSRKQSSRRAASSTRKPARRSAGSSRQQSRRTAGKQRSRSVRTGGNRRSQRRAA